MSFTSFLLLVLAESVGEPVETLVQTITSGGASSLDVPLTTHVGETETLGDLVHRHGVGEILLVGEHKKDGVAELVLTEHAVKLLLGTVLGTTLVINTLLIVGIDDEDDTLGVLVVVTPQRTDLVLTTDIPHGEGDVLVLDSLDVETDGGDGGDDLSKLQLVKDGSLTGGIESDHQNTHLLLTEETVESLGKKVTHGGSSRRYGL